MSVRDESVVRRDAYMWGLVAELECHRVRLEAMRAANLERAQAGFEAKYKEADFDKVADAIRGVANTLMTEV